jgi:3-methylcrotonyl-CoA carboxylase alpha subunit
MRVHLRHKQDVFTADVHAEGRAYRVVIDGTEHGVEAQHLGDGTLVLVIDGRRYRVDLARNGRERFVAVGGEVYTFIPESGGASAHRVAAVAQPEICAPMPGKVLQVLVRPGNHVEAGDGLLILEAMKMESRLTAEAAATVAAVHVSAGDMVEGGQVLVVLAFDEGAEAEPG